MGEHEAKNATPAAELERQIMSWSEPKNEREWWALHEIERLRTALEAAEARSKADEEAMREALRKAAKIAQNACLVPPDGGAPTETERELCESIATAILSLAKNEPTRAEVADPLHNNYTSRPGPDYYEYQKKMTREALKGALLNDED